jgi:hypothetical protein
VELLINNGAVKAQKEEKMNPISPNQKIKVIRLFFSGYSYDEIAAQIGIAKGSVVNIIDEFREGKFPLPVGMTEYLDALRKLVVDMNKHSLTVSALKSYAHLDLKLKKMGVNPGQVDEWLDICQAISNESVANSQFVSGALELAKVTADTGIGYEAALATHKAKLEAIKAPDTEFDLKKKMVAQFKQKTKKDTEQAKKKLESITKAIAAAKEAFANQTKEIQSKLDQHLSEHKLTMAQVDVVAGVVQSKLSEAGLTDEVIDSVSQEIAATGSLTTHNLKLKEESLQLQAEVEELTNAGLMLSNGLVIMGKRVGELIQTISEKVNEEKAIDARLTEKGDLLVKVKGMAATYAHDLYVTCLILGLLTSPKLLSDQDFDNLVGLMVGCRQRRLGTGPKVVKDAKGKIICECGVPCIINAEESDYEAAIDKVRTRLAGYLVPLVKDQFVPKFEYDQEQNRKALADLWHDYLELLSS